MLGISDMRAKRYKNCFKLPILLIPETIFTKRYKRLASYLCGIFKFTDGLSTSVEQNVSTAVL